MNKEEERNYVFAQLSSLPNAFQYVSVTNYIENLERENKELKEHIEKYEHYCKTTGIEELMKENKQLKEENEFLKSEIEEAKRIFQKYLEYIGERDERINKAIKYIEDTYYSKNTTDIDSIVLSNNELLKIRKILKEVE